MKVLIINSICGFGSTGRLSADIARKYLEDGNSCFFAYGRGNVPKDIKDYTIRIGGDFSFFIHVLYTRLTGKHGLASKIATIRFLKWVEKYNPDLIWLHNIHGYYINYEMLFIWLKSHNKIKIKWTLHDEWAFTGHCGCYNSIGCDKWKTGCFDCPQIKEYPKSLFRDSSKTNYMRKKEAFTRVSNLELITPSCWLRDQVSKSFLTDYPIKICRNSVDTTIFKPTASNFRKKYNLESHFIILGVATAWQKCKGLYDFVELSNRLDDSFKIVLVGLSKKQLKRIPSKIMGFERTDNIRELAEIYSSADIFANPSTEESFGMTTLEATMCGTFTVVYKGTACEELITSYSGIAIDPNVNSLEDAIIKIAKEMRHKNVDIV